MTSMKRSDAPFPSSTPLLALLALLAGCSALVNADRSKVDDPLYDGPTAGAPGDEPGTAGEGGGTGEGGNAGESAGGAPGEGLGGYPEAGAAG
jgi:hypothetical protein